MVKKNAFIALLIIKIAMLASCSYSKLKDKVKGNGKIEMREVLVKSFTKIKSETTANIFISQDSSMRENRVKIETDQNLQDKINVYVDGETLIIENNGKMDRVKATKMNIYIRVSNLTFLENNSIGKLKFTSPVKVKHLNVSNSSVGELFLDVVGDSLTADLSSVGSATLKGNLISANITNESVGKLDAEGLIVKILRLDNSSIGSVAVYASDELYLESTGIGKVTYSGNAVIKQFENEGMGKVEKK